MLAQEILERVEADAAGAVTSKWDWDFRQHMLQVPVLSMLKDPAGRPCQVWVVLQQSPDGYSVIFDPEDNEFGLATGGVVIGYYGGFMATLNAM
jgi:hypothetical protein